MGGPAARDVYSRLLLAVALSAGLHLSLIYGVAPRPGVLAHPVPPLAARLVPELMRAMPVEAGRRVVPLPPSAKPPHELLTSLVAPPDVPLVAAPPASGDASVQRREDSTLPKADLPFPVDLQWYEARDLDVYPHALNALEPVEQSSESSGADRGFVTLLVSIDETGSVHEAAVVDAEPPGYFDASAQESVRRARFSPGEKDGHAVRSKLIVKLHFGRREQAPR